MTKTYLKNNSVIKTRDPISFSNGVTFQVFKKINKVMHAGVIVDGAFQSKQTIRLDFKHPAWMYEVLTDVK
jgi:hypothetical protein